MLQVRENDQIYFGHVFKFLSLEHVFFTQACQLRIRKPDRFLKPQPGTYLKKCFWNADKRWKQIVWQPFLYHTYSEKDFENTLCGRDDESDKGGRISHKECLQERMR